MLRLLLRLGTYITAPFLIGFLYLYQTEKVREMLIDEQRLLNVENNLIEENRQLELEIANLCALDNLRKSIPDSSFGFPPPNKIVHLHWLSEPDKADLRARAGELVLDWFQEVMDVKPPSYADSTK